MPISLTSLGAGGLPLPLAAAAGLSLPLAAPSLAAAGFSSFF